jgi:hypothetical protein
MAFRNLSLHQVTIKKKSLEQGLIDMWHNLDSDYSEEGAHEAEADGGCNWRVDGDLQDLGFKSQAEKLVKQMKWSKNDTVIRKISRVLEMVADGHGDYSSSFRYEIKEIGVNYVVAISFLT